MRNKIILWAAFAFMVTSQLGVPAQMIYERENILESGIEFKFKVAPIDPNDPFRGKFIILNFSADSIDVSKESQWKMNETVYVKLATSADGMAIIKAVSKEKPTANISYLKTKVAYINTSKSETQTLFIEYPFTRFYMEETKAPLAEKLYNQATADSSQIAWALVSIKNGEGVLKDVYLNGKPISESVIASSVSNNSR